MRFFSGFSTTVAFKFKLITSLFCSAPYQSHQQTPSDAQSYSRSPRHDHRGPGSPPSSQRVSSPSSTSSLGSRSDRPGDRPSDRHGHRRDDRIRGPDKPPRDQNENNVFQFPKQPKRVSWA